MQRATASVLVIAQTVTALLGVHGSAAATQPHNAMLILGIYLLYMYYTSTIKLMVHIIYLARAGRPGLIAAGAGRSSQFKFVNQIR